MFNFPWTNFHELNLDWILSVVKEAKEVFDNGRYAIDYAVSTADEAKEIATQAAEATIADNSISTAKIQDGAVTHAKLANNSVTTENIVDRTITGTDIAENTITNYNIENGSLIGADLADGTITATQLGSGCVTRAKLAQDIYNYLFPESNGVMTQINSTGTGIMDSVVCHKTGNFVAVSARIHSIVNEPATGNFFSIPDGYRPNVALRVSGYMYIDGNAVPMTPAIYPNGNVEFGYSASKTTTQVAFSGFYLIGGN